MKATYQTISASDNMEKSIAVFCSSSNLVSPKLKQDARELGKWIAKHNYSLIYGGVNKGLMEEVAQGASQEGTTITGILPVEMMALASPHLTTAISVKNLSQRKEMIIHRSSLLIALPGAIGTLDEIFTLLASNQIGECSKHLILYNPENHWDTLLQLLHRLYETGYSPNPLPPTLHIAITLSQLFSIIKELV